MKNTTDVSQAIEEKISRIGQCELEAALNKLQHLSDEEKRVLVKLVSNITAQIAQTPHEKICNANDKQMIRVAKNLFDLE